MIPEGALLQSINEIALDGSMGNEGIVLWLGKRQRKVAKVTHLIVLRGPDVIKEPNFLIIKPSLFNLVTDVVIELGAALIGQMHSHAGYRVDLSWADCIYGVSVPYYLSIVVPHYAMKIGTDIGGSSVHVFEPGTGYRQLTKREASRCIHIISGEHVPVLTVGEDSDGR
jgi:proteasome lid subunit RPN8/RPN11